MQKLQKISLTLIFAIFFGLCVCPAAFCAEAGVKEAYDEYLKSYGEFKNLVETGADQDAVDACAQKYKNALDNYKKLLEKTQPAVKSEPAKAAAQLPETTEAKPAVQVQAARPAAVQPAVKKAGFWEKAATFGKKALDSTLGGLKKGLMMLNEVLIRPLKQGVAKASGANKILQDNIKEKIMPKRIDDAVYDMTTVEGLTGAIQKDFKISVEAGSGGKWTAEELKGVYGLLKQMPPEFRKYTTTIVRDKESERAEGFVNPIMPWKVHLCGTSYYVKETLAHEMTHSYQFNNLKLTNDWNREFFGSRIAYLAKMGKPKTASVSEYGDTNSLEDMAESVREYYENPENMKKTQPGRYEFVKNRIMKGVELKN